MATDVADYTQAVNVTGGSVAITGTATVVISGTVPVSISGTPTVNIGTTPTITITGSVTIASGTVAISGTVPVTISSGSVTITGTPSITIAGQTITVNVNQPQTALASLSFPANAITTVTTATVPAGTHSLLLRWTGFVGDRFQSVKGHQTGATYWPINENLDNPGGVLNGTLLGGAVAFTVPIDASQDTSYDVNYNNAALAGPLVMLVTAVLDTQVVQVRGSFLSPVPVMLADPQLGGNPLAGQRTSAFSVPVVVASDSIVAVQQGKSTRASYRAVGVFTCPANPTDIAQILGSSTKTIFVTYVRVGLIETAAAINNLFLIKRSSNNTGASNVALATPLDSNDPASTAGDIVHGISVYLANPTALGTAVGSGIGGIRYFTPVAASTTYSASQAWEFGVRGVKPVVLRGTTEGLYVNLGGSGNAGLAVVVEFEWWEE